MGLTLRDPGLDGCNRAGGVGLGPRPDRSEPCRCGSGSKYKRCCLERDEAFRRQRRGAALPEWLDSSRSKLRQFEKYACNVFALPDLPANLTDKRRDPKIPTFMDALYANGPVMTQLDQYGYGGFRVLKKDNNEPLKEALALWQEQGPCEQTRTRTKKSTFSFGTATTSRPSIPTKERSG